MKGMQSRASCCAVVALALSLAMPACTDAGSVERPPEASLVPAMAPNVREADTHSASRSTKASGTERFRKGMAYADFRAAAMTEGWRPARDPACRVNLAGANHAQLCDANPGLRACAICDELEELSSCSSDGYCVVKFHGQPGTRLLEAVTYGDIGDWKTKGARAGLTIDSWEIANDE